MNVPLSQPDISKREIEYVVRTLRSGRLSLGPRVTEFEEKFANYVGRRHAVAVSSGTAALHLCVRALDIGPGDAVLTTSFSFVASANCLLYERALPVFLDIHPLTLNLDPAEIAAYLQQGCTRRADGRVVDKSSGRAVKGILPVHVFGLPCDMDPIRELADEYGLWLIEDACEALGAEYRGRRVGTFGDVAAFAFYPNKQMTTAEGGMIVTDDPRIADLCRSMRNQGRDPGADGPFHARLGFNYRLSDLHCALGLAQLERLDELLHRREQVAALYRSHLAGHPWLLLPQTPAGCTRSWFVYVVQIAAAPAHAAEQVRARLLRALRARGIGCQIYFPAIHQQSYFQQSTQSLVRPLPRTESASARSLALPFFTQATADEIRYVCDTLLETLQGEVANTRAQDMVPR